MDSCAGFLSIVKNPNIVKNQLLYLKGHFIKVSNIFDTFEFCYILFSPKKSRIFCQRKIIYMEKIEYACFNLHIFSIILKATSQVVTQIFSLHFTMVKLNLDFYGTRAYYIVFWYQHHCLVLCKDGFLLRKQ